MVAAQAPVLCLSLSIPIYLYMEREGEVAAFGGNLSTGHFLCHLRIPGMHAFPPMGMFRIPGRATSHACA